MRKLKKVISFILALVMALTLLPSAPITAFAADANFTGSGTEADPFIIQNNADLVKLAELVDSSSTYSTYAVSSVSYKLSDKFDNSGDPFTGPPIGKINKAFQAKFNGNYRTITLNMSSDLYNLGLFGEIEDAVIENLRTVGSVKSTSNSSSDIGGIAGTARRDAVIKNCVSEANVSGLGGSYLGGILGAARSGTPLVTNSYFIGTVSISSGKNMSMGGIVGCMFAGSITNCYAVPNLTGGTAGGIAGDIYNDAKISYCAFAKDATTGSAISITGATNGGSLSSNLSDAAMEYMKQQAFLDMLNKNRGSYSEWMQNASLNEGYPYLNGFIFDTAPTDPDDPDDPTDPTDPASETVIRVPGTDDSGNIRYNINLSTEKLELATETSLTFKSYSMDGGTKWTSGTPFDKNSTDSLSKFLDKGGKLVLATEAPDKKTKALPEGTIKVSFAEVAKRDKTAKRIVNYLMLNTENLYSATATSLWTLTKTATDTEASIDGISYSLADSTGKKSAGNWYEFPKTGIEVKPLPDSGKAGKVTYFYHVAAQKTGDKYTPATKMAKLTVSTQIKAPTLKPDYKKEVLKAKAGVSIQVGTASSLGFSKSDKGNALLVDLTNAIDNGEKVTVFTVATSKKPASASQIIQMATRPDLSDAAGAVTVSGGKVTLGKDYEANTSETGIWNDGSGKWGKYKVHPANQIIILVDDTGMIRKKSTVKLDKNGNVASGSPASEAFCLVVFHKNTAAENKPTAFKPDSYKIGKCVVKDNLEWIVFSDHVMLSGYSPDSENLPRELVIPDTIESKPVTGIMSKAFYKDNTLTKVTIPAGVTSIGFAAFASSQVAQVTFSYGSKLETISASAFGECKITSISLPATVKQIGTAAFRGTSLTEVTFNGSKPVFFDYDNKSNDGKDVFGDVSSSFKIKYMNGDASWADYTVFPTEAFTPQ